MSLSSFNPYTKGSMLDVFRHTALTAVIKEYLSNTRAFTFIDWKAGGTRYDISGSSRRLIGVDCVYKYGKRQAEFALTNIKSYQPHPFIPLMRRTREINSPSADQLPRLKSDFQFYPGSPALIKPVLRKNDRVILCEDDPFNREQIQQYFGNDRRLALYETSFADPNWDAKFVNVISKPMTAHALVNLSIEANGPTQLEAYARTVGKDIIQQAVRQCPHATYVVTYPIFGRAYKDDLVRDVVKTGIRHVLSATFHLQDTVSLQPPCGPLADEEPWGVGVIIGNPPEDFDKYMKMLSKQCRDVLNSQFQDVVDQFPHAYKHPLEVSTQDYWLAHESIVSSNDLPPRPEVVWCTPRSTDHIRPAHAFKWDYHRAKLEYVDPKKAAAKERALNAEHANSWSGYETVSEAGKRIYSAPTHVGGKPVFSYDSVKSRAQLVEESIERRTSRINNLRTITNMFEQFEVQREAEQLEARAAQQAAKQINSTTDSTAAPAS